MLPTGGGSSSYQFGGAYPNYPGNCVDQLLLVKMPPKTGSTATCCPICVKLVLDEEEGIQCDSDCQRWFHVKCLGMPRGDYAKFSADLNLKWNCNRLDCTVPTMQSNRDIGDMLNMLIAKIDDLGSKVSSLLPLPGKIDEMERKIDSINVKLDTLESRIERNEDRIEQLEHKLADVHSSNVASASEPEHIFAEWNDRLKRASNAIIYNLPEKSSSSVNARVKHDSDWMSNLLGVFQIQISPLTMKCVRIGKPSKDKPRPLKVFFPNAEFARDFCSKFSGEEVKRAFPDLPLVSVGRDRTSRERTHLQQLRAELAERSKNGEKDITIKFINGVPAITKNLQKN